MILRRLLARRKRNTSIGRVEGGRCEGDGVGCLLKG